MTQNQRPSGRHGRPEIGQDAGALQRQQRVLLTRRVRAVRRSLLVGGVAGTVAFSALAGYETHTANSSSSTPPTEQAPQTQSTSAGFFAGQATSALGPATPTATATPGVNVAATAAARANAAATATARAGIAAAEAADARAAATETAEADAAATETAEAEEAATETAEAMPTDTPTPVVEEEAPAPPQRSSRSQSSS